jgi:DNA-binding beta-propeller fold protein YncE
MRPQLVRTKALAVAAALAALATAGLPSGKAIAAQPLPVYDKVFAGEASASMYPVDVSDFGGDLYVLDPGRYRILRVHVENGAATIVDQFGGHQGRAPGQLAAARAIAHDSAGNVYVADTPNNRIEIFGINPNLHYITKWGGMKGTGPGQFNMPYGVAVGPGLDGNNQNAEIAYVVDQEGRIQAFTLNGTFVRQFGKGQLNQPRQVAVNTQTKDVYVVNARDHQIVVYSPTGTKKFAFGSGGKNDGQFSGDPRGIAITPDGSTVLVTDSLGRRIEAFNSSNGAFKFKFGSQGVGDSKFTDPRGLTVRSDGAVFVVDEWDYAVKQFQLNATNTGVTTTFNRYFGTPAPLGGVNSPRGLVVDGSGRLVVVEWWNNRLQRFNADGTNPLAWGKRGTTAVPGSINFAWDVALQPSTGRLFVANRESDEIEVFDGNGAFVTRWGKVGTADGFFKFPQGVAFLPNGNLVVTDSGNNRVQVFSIDGAGKGTFVSKYGTTGAGVGQFNTPAAVSTASDGSIYVADTRNNRIQKRSPSGTWTAIASAGGVTFKLPWGVTVAPDDTVWVADSGHNQIVKLEPDGTLDFAFSGTDLGGGSTAFDSPYKVAFGPSGRIYISDLWNNRIIQLHA